MQSRSNMRTARSAVRLSTTVAALTYCMIAVSVRAQVRPMGDTTKTPGMAGMPGSGMTGMMMTMGPHQALAMAYGESLTAFTRALDRDVARSHMVDLELARPATVEMRRSFDQMKAHHAAQMSSTGMPMASAMTRDTAMAHATALPPRPAMSRDSAMKRSSAMSRDSAKARSSRMPGSVATKPDAAMIRDSAMARSASTIPRDTTMRGMAGMPGMSMGSTDMQKGMDAIGMHLAMLETEVALAAPDAAKVAEHTAEILKLCEGMMPHR